MRIPSVAKQTLLGAVSIAIFIVCLPVATAHGSIFSVFQELTSTVTGIGGLVGSINTAVNEMSNLKEALVFPLQGLQDMQNLGTNLIDSYRQPMENIFSAPINSAQTPNISNLEDQMLSGQQLTSGSAGSFNLNQAYSAAFLPRPSATGTTSQVSQQTLDALDMNDAVAQDSLTQAAFGDSASTQEVSLAHNLENGALSTSAGSAEQVEASALAATVQAVAIEHQLLAAQLRMYAMQLAVRGSQLKESVEATSNAAGAIGNLNNLIK